MTAPASFIGPADLRAALSPGTFLLLFDDDNSGSVDDSAPQVLLVIERAHAECLSYLPRAYDSYPTNAPTLLRSAELDFAVALAFDRHPELAKTMGTTARNAAWKRASEKMENVANSVQQMTDNAPTLDPGTEGGLIFDNSRRTIIDSADGTYNGGDF